MKKVLLVVCAMLLVCSSVSMAELIGDDVQFDVLFTDESPYFGLERVRVSVLVVNGNPAYQPIRLLWQMMDPLGNVAQGTIQKSVYPYFAGTLSFGKPLPEGAFPGLYTWTGIMNTQEADGSWNNIGQKQVSFFVGDSGSSGPSGSWDFYCSLYPDSFAKGESFTMDALVGNGTESEANVFVQSLITGPGGAEYLLGPHALTVQPASNTSVRFVINSYLGAPAGGYSVAQQLIDGDNQLLNEVVTTFSITGASFSMLHGDALLALAAIPEESKLDPEYNVAADLDNIVTLFNAGDIQGALDLALAMIDYLPTKFTTAGDFAPALDDVVDYLEASLSSNFTYSLN
jgi:hypothetical protein